jgi:hypothetical protein
MQLEFNTGMKLYKQMKSSLIIIGTALCAMLVIGCNKSEETLVPEEKLVRFLTGETGNRVWRINKIYQNGVEVSLTVDQTKFTKTYTRIGTQPYSGTFTDSDGNVGKWTLSSIVLMIEVITNNPAGNIKIDFVINSITQNALDVEYTANGKTIRTVFYAS